MALTGRAAASSRCCCSSQAAPAPFQHPCRTLHSRGKRASMLRSQTLASAADAVAAAASTTTALLEWLHQQGCAVQGVVLGYGKAPDGQIYRELRADKDLRPGDVLVSVPLTRTLHYREADIVQQAPSAAATEPAGTDSSSSCRRAALRQLQSGVPTASGGSQGAWQFKMALEVLHHAADSASPLQPYIQTLPGQCPGIPTPQVAMLWPKQDLQECQSAQLTADAGSQAYWLEAYSRDVLAWLPGTSDGDAFGGQLITQERLGWALAVSMSRAFGFKKLGGYALAPLIDMANHAPVSNAEVRYSEDTRRINLIANKKVVAGTPILLNYGSHDNANLLLSYGFIVPDNPADRVRVDLDMDTLLAAIVQFVGGELPPTGRATDALKQWQRTALQELGLLPTATAAEAAAAAAPAVEAAAAAPAGEAAAAAPAGEAAAAAPAGEAAAAAASASQAPQPGVQQGVSQQCCPVQQQTPTSQQQQQQQQQQREPSHADHQPQHAPQGQLQQQQQQQQQQQPNQGLVAVVIGGTPPVSGPLLAAVRVVLAQDRAAVKSSSLEQLGDWSRPLSAQHEALVMKALVGLCTVLYKSLPTTIQEDKAKLASMQRHQPLASVDEHERLLTAVQFRLGQKLLLEHSTKQLMQRLLEVAAS